MVATCSAYIIMQFCSLFFMYSKDKKDMLQAEESNYVLVACIACWVCLVVYLYQQVYADDTDNARELKRERVMQDAIATGKVSLLGLVSYEFTAHRDIYLSFLQKYDQLAASSVGTSVTPPTENTPLTNSVSKLSRRGSMSEILSESAAVINTEDDKDCLKGLTRLERILKPFFIKYDINASGDLDMKQLGRVINYYVLGFYVVIMESTLHYSCCLQRFG